MLQAVLDIAALAEWGHPSAMVAEPHYGSTDLVPPQCMEQLLQKLINGAEQIVTKMMAPFSAQICDRLDV